MSKPYVYYEDRDTTLWCGRAEEVLPMIEAVDLVLTDPPYGVLSKSGSAATRRSGGNKTNGVMEWDIAPNSDLIQAIFKAGNERAIWGGCHLALPPTFGYLIWDKQIDGLNFGEVEFCWTSGKFAPRIFRYRAVGVDGGKVHPTQKPLRLMQWCLEFFPKAKSVLDPFTGSGTTLKAAKNLGIKAVGIEIEEHYCEIAVERLAQQVMPFDLPPPPTAQQSESGGLFELFQKGECDEEAN